VPIVAIVMGVGIGFWRIYWDYQRRRLEYDERRTMIEKGMTPLPLTPDLPRRRPGTLEDSLRRGIVMLFLGIGLGIGFAILRSSMVQRPDRDIVGILAIGAPVVLLIGLGNLVYYVVAKREKTQSQ